MVEKLIDLQGLLGHSIALWVGLARGAHNLIEVFIDVLTNSLILNINKSQNVFRLNLNQIYFDFFIYLVYS
jgi:hypothetical protein